MAQQQGPMGQQGPAGQGVAEAEFGQMHEGGASTEMGSMAQRPGMGGMPQGPEMGGMPQGPEMGGGAPREMPSQMKDNWYIGREISLMVTVQTHPVGRRLFCPTFVYLLFFVDRKPQSQSSQPIGMWQLSLEWEATTTDR